MIKFNLNNKTLKNIYNIIITNYKNVTIILNYKYKKEKI